MDNYEYDEADLPEVVPGEYRKYQDIEYRIVQSGEWSMECVEYPLNEDGDSLLPQVEKTILAWIAYRNWLEKNPPKGV